ncbi:MAG: hypothetical protein B7Z37_20940 [Verrucomicrobia bacterium 12-59-8]|nr:MAG: hypothetical protein B7Z37_20940 [Verrucomicrobia bacterium 12-59-8]
MMNMNGAVVTLDLNVIDKVLDAAVFELHDRLQRELHDINEHIRSAHLAALRGDLEDQHYLGLCRANTGRESLAKVALSLADAIHAKFHVAEAIKRQEVVVVKNQTPA